MREAFRIYDVVVVGGGVSGTSCALGCAEAGYSVVVLSSSLDVVGLPGYGPVVGTVPAHFRQVVKGLPRGAGRAWRDELLVEENGGAAVVDPRRLSLRLKWELEVMGRIDLRQGLVVAVEEVKVGALQGLRARVRTALEEEFTARACVLAPGLGLRGRSRVGRQLLGGGRYGEVPADDLSEHLRQAGVRTKLSRLEVGGCYCDPDMDAQSGMGGQVDLWWEGLRRAGGPRAEVRELAGLQAGEDSVDAMPEDRRPTPDLAIAPPSQRRRKALVQADGRGLFPVGEELEEWYLSPGLDPGPFLAAGLAVTRPPYLVEAEQIVFDPCSSRGRRLKGTTTVWAAGRVAGCATCWESLLSGQEAAERVSAYLSEA